MYRLKNSSLYFRLKWLFLFLILGSACGEADTAQTIIANTGEAEEKIPPADTGKVSAKTDETFSIEYLMGKFDPERHPDFVKVDKKYADDDQKLLRKDAYEAFLKMREAALKDGIELKILSATRNFNRQKTIWEAKWNGSRLVENQDLSKTIPNPEKRALKILEYSSMPGTSRHHWGTDIDLNSLEPAYFKSGTGKKIYAWLSENAATFGYCQPYSPKGEDRPFGYNEEQWHWSYMPVAKKLTDLAERSLKNEMISGFLGAETASGIDVVSKFVLGINPACR